ncbi:MAG TPA: hypothetical protein DEB39_10840 [Planctomycetaceae bacterium]|nr:hypothetical protein [Planctomycetaceae bacterium]
MYNVLHFETLGSTNDKGKELLSDSLTRTSLPLVIRANHQTAGRGRNNKRWWTGPGMLAFSVVVDLEAYGLERQTLPAFSPVIAEVVAGLIRETLDTQGFRGKYETTVHEPNDVHVDGKKITGILIESPRPGFAIFGIGINTNNSMRDAPEEFYRAPFTTLYDLCGRPVDNERFLHTFLDRLLERLREGSTPKPG